MISHLRLVLQSRFFSQQPLVASIAAMGPVEKSITKKLKEAYNPTKLVVTNNSASHRGHAEVSGLPDPLETHFSIEIISDKFKNTSRVASHREVYKLLKQELDDGLHALEIKTSAPSA